VPMAVPGERSSAVMRRVSAQGLRNQDLGLFLHQKLPVSDEFVPGGGLDPFGEGKVGEVGGVVQQEHGNVVAFIDGDLSELKAAHRPGGVFRAPGQDKEKFVHGPPVSVSQRSDRGGLKPTPTAFR
jgi:hypothetical protein